ncbi:hydrolase [Curtobacterium sp. MCBD17_040]|uniref:hydrolase n=1 Tax=Curtobacterium sp. MCBD17_040 TaxID=2175674 RepID=UPI001C64551F|nr:hydrolase [Curtobacterium sp. MCBD17_040]WIB65748.1 hydrolase [Curtobacterium sp. MCBD17_040]
MKLSPEEIGELVPAGGWPDWVFACRWLASAHPQATRFPPLTVGANCQRFAYAVLGLFNLTVPAHRSDELWNDLMLEHPPIAAVEPLDLVLFNGTSDARGAHVAVAMPTGLLHLSAEVGRPTLWQWSDFSHRQRYRAVVGAIRVPADGAH